MLTLTPTSVVLPRGVSRYLEVAVLYETQKAGGIVHSMHAFLLLPTVLEEPTQ